MRKYLSRKPIILAIVVAVVILGLLAARPVYERRITIIQSPLVTHFIPLYRSLRKLPDIFFIHYLVFNDSGLDKYSLTISPENIQKLNEPLPDNPFARATRLLGESKVWVPANFTAGEYSDRVQVRYRGNQLNHWGNYKKSYLIKFPKDNLFNGMRGLVLVIPSDRRYFAMSLNNYRSKKMGLLVPDEKLVAVNLNGVDYGPYLAFERWSQEWLEKNPINADSMLIGTADVASDVVGLPSLYTKDGLSYWESWNVEEIERLQEPLKALIEVVEKADDATFERLIPQLVDLEQFYARDVISILSGSFHNAGPIAGANNLVIYFNGEEGRFKPIPYNSVLFPPEDGFDGEPTDLQKRIWSIPRFKAERDAYFEQYVAEHEADDLAFFEAWMEEHKSAFYADFTKQDNNLTFWQEMRSLEAAMRDYFADPFAILEREYTVPERATTTLAFADSFSQFADLALSVPEFIAKHPEFRSGPDDTLLLPRGQYTFAADLIIPPGTTLTIAPGTTIRMGRGVSLVSYSPVIARGTEAAPISIAPAEAGAAWGVLAVVNTEEKLSHFAEVKLSGGGEDRINGVFFSGMLALHNADGTIESSVFRGAQGDDGVNVKGGRVAILNNQFLENSSDGIDIDFPDQETLLKDNEFKDNAGDCVDISWSDITIAGNTITGCGDKGVSVGESSHPLIAGNYIAGSDMGIAIKDLSVATITKNQIINNRVAVAAYQKKPIFGGGHGIVRDNILSGNRQQSFTDHLSEVKFEHNTTTAP